MGPLLLQHFVIHYKITHITGIPYNPQGQGIIERANRSLKLTIEKIKRGELYRTTPHNLINHALFILNVLTVDKFGCSAGGRLVAEPRLASQSPEVLWKDPLTSTWRGPDPVLIWGRGHVCIFPRSAPGPCWLPERLVKQIDGSPQLT